MTQCKCYCTALCSGSTHTHRVQGPCLMMWGPVGLAHTNYDTVQLLLHCIGYLRAKHLERAECLEGCRDLMQEFSLCVCVRSTVVMMAFTHTGHLWAHVCQDIDRPQVVPIHHVCMHANTIAALHVSEHYIRDQTCKVLIERDRCNVVMLNAAVSSACLRSFSSLRSLPLRLRSPSCLRTLPQHAEYLQWRNRVC